MIAVAVVAAALAAALLCLPPGRRLRRRLRPAIDGPRSGPPVGLLAVGVVGVSALVLGGAGWGSRGVAVALSSELVVATSITVGRAVIVERRSAADRSEVAHACQVLARLVAAGQTPVEALQTAAEDCQVLVEAASLHRIGGDPVSAWRTGAHRPGQSGLLALARAWQVSRSSGAAMARPLGDVAAALRAERALANVVTSELSAPRATGRLLALLPVAGLGLGYLIGGDPVAFLLDQWIGQICLVVGIALACAGVVWVERLAAPTATGI